MLISAVILVSFVLSVTSFPAEKQQEEPRRIKAPDGKLHIFALPIGQGDTNLIQCPGGDITIFDFGSSNKGNRNDGFWDVEELKEYLENDKHRIRNVIITHNHFDHYSYLNEVLDSRNELPRLQNIYHSCTYQAMREQMQDWVQDIDGVGLLRSINGGDRCGPNGVPCGFIDLCPNDQSVTAKIMAANYGQHCSSGPINPDSIVIKIEFDDVSILMNGDFEDFTSSWGEEGPQKAMVDFYGDELKVTVYQVSHHGASFLANKPVIRDAVQPRAVFSSGNFWFSYGHPRCVVFDAFINFVNPPLCKPGDTSGPYYCGELLPNHNHVQSSYTCGLSSTTERLVTDNEYAIYTTTPDYDSMNLIDFATDGRRWGFEVDNMPRLRTLE